VIGYIDSDDGGGSSLCNVSFEAFTAVMFQAEVFCVMILCSVAVGY